MGLEYQLTAILYTLTKKGALEPRLCVVPTLPLRQSDAL
jgi:hypothetical protein